MDVRSQRRRHTSFRAKTTGVASALHRVRALFAAPPEASRQRRSAWSRSSQTSDAASSAGSCRMPRAAPAPRRGNCLSKYAFSRTNFSKLTHLPFPVTPTESETHSARAPHATPASPRHLQVNGSIVSGFEGGHLARARARSRFPFHANGLIELRRRARAVRAFSRKGLPCPRRARGTSHWRLLPAGVVTLFDRSNGGDRHRAKRSDVVLHGGTKKTPASRADLRRGTAAREPQ